MTELADRDGVLLMVDAKGRRKTFISMLIDDEREKYDILHSLMPDVDVVAKIMDQRRETVSLLSIVGDRESHMFMIDAYSHYRQLADFCWIKYEMKHGRTDDMSILYGCYLRDKDGCLCYDNYHVRNMLINNTLGSLWHSNLFIYYERMIRRSYIFYCEDKNYKKKFKMHRPCNVTDKWVYMCTDRYKETERFCIKYVCNGFVCKFTYSRREALRFRRDNKRRSEWLRRDGIYIERYI